MKSAAVEHGRAHADWDTTVKGPLSAFHDQGKAEEAEGVAVLIAMIFGILAAALTAAVLSVLFSM